MSTRTIKKGLKEISVYDQSEDGSDVIIEIFQERGHDVTKDSICTQIRLTEDDVEKLIQFLRKNI